MFPNKCHLLYVSKNTMHILINFICLLCNISDRCFNFIKLYILPQLVPRSVRVSNWRSTKACKLVISKIWHFKITDITLGFNLMVMVKVSIRSGLWILKVSYIQNILERHWVENFLKLCSFVKASASGLVCLALMLLILETQFRRLLDTKRHKDYFT